MECTSTVQWQCTLQCSAVYCSMQCSALSSAAVNCYNAVAVHSTVRCGVEWNNTSAVVTFSGKVQCYYPHFWGIEQSLIRNIKQNKYFVAIIGQIKKKSCLAHKAVTWWLLGPPPCNLKLYFAKTVHPSPLGTWCHLSTARNL